MKISHLWPFGESGLSLDERERRRAARSEGVRDILMVSGVIMLCFVAFLGLTFVLLPMQELRSAEQERDRRALELKASLAEEQRQRDICTALERDPEFNEVIARDKGLARPGESVIHFPANPAPPTPTDHRPMDR